MKNVSLVISCGGAKGLVGIGVIEELERRGYNISSVAGTSIGSVILGIYASGNLKEYKKWMLSLGRLDVFRLMDFTLSTRGVIKGKKVFEEMKNFFPDTLIEDLPIPYSAVAADVNTFKEVSFEKGSLHQAIRCSISVPSLMTPVINGSQILVDGGVVNPLPLSTIQRTKNDILIAVNLNHFDPSFRKKISPFSLDYPIIKEMLNCFSSSGKKKAAGNMVTFLHKTAYIMMSQLSENSIQKYKPDVLINIPYNICGFFDYHETKKLIQIGVDKTIEALNNYENNE